MVKRTINETDLLKKVKTSIKPIQEGLLKFDEFNELCLKILNYINEATRNNNYWQLKLRKFDEEYNRGNIHVDYNDYISISRTKDSKSGWEHFEPFVDILNLFLNERKIVKKLEDENLWVDSRVDGKINHLFVGERKEQKRKVHLIFDNGQIRFDKDDTAPSELLNKVESILKTKDGKTIKSVLEFND